MTKDKLTKSLIDIYEHRNEEGDQIYPEEHMDTVASAVIMIGGVDFFEHVSSQTIYDLMLENQKLGAELTDLLHFSYEIDQEDEQAIQTTPGDSYEPKTEHTQEDA